MPQSDDERLVDLAARFEQQDPRPARPVPRGRPARPHGHRRAPGWWTLGTGLALLVAGVVLPDGLLVAAGLVLSGIAVHLLDPVPPPRPEYPHGRPPR